MKKLMFAIAVAATVGFAHAELTSTGFETGAYTAGNPLNTEVDDDGDAVEVGEVNPTRVWAQATDVESTVKAYGADDADAKPTITGVTELGDNYLAVEGKIERLAQEGGTAVEIGGGLYIDTVVKFSATDAEAEGPDGVEEGDKLCIWLKGNEEDDTQCTLMVTAGYIVDFEASSIASHSYETTTKLANNSWHHLQVKVLPAMDDDGYLGNGFVVYIDGQAVAATESVFNSDVEPDYKFNARAAAYASENKLFPSLIPYGGNGDGTITSLAFKGSGAVDNISFTQGTDPNPQLIAEADMPAAVSGLVENGKEQYGVAGNLEDAAYAFRGDVKAAVAGNYTAIATLLEGWAWADGTTAPTNITWTIASSGSGSDDYDSGDGQSKFTIDATTKAALEAALPAGKTTLADAVAEGSSLTYAQAYALGLWDAEATEVADLDATISIGADGKITVKLANQPAEGYSVTCKVFEKSSLTTAEWTLKETYAYGSEKTIAPASSTAGFYKVEVVISNAQ
jgi:hypothetical protein